MYAEASSPRVSGDKARLESSTIPANPSKSVCLNFWYNMHGNGIGSLNVYVKKGGVMGTAAWTRHDHQGADWKEASVSIPSSNAPFTIVFEAVRGSSAYGDIAIDDVLVSDTSCAHPGNCNFDTGYCSWTNDVVHDQFDWQRTSRTTGSYNTGPVNDHTLKNSSGQYVFIDASSPRVQGDTARFVSQDLNSTLPSCLHFWYNMHGNTIGTLNVWVSQYSDGSLLPIWSLQGQQGTDWLPASAKIPPQTDSYQVIFEGKRGSNWDGDIALDDITFDGAASCDVSPTKARPTFGAVTLPPNLVNSSPTSSTTGKPSSTPSGQSVSCDFESNTCGWSQNQNDDFDWRRNTYGTSSTSTGPTRDHTTGFGYYMYIETSSYNYGDKAVLTSAQISRPTGSTKCFSMWYSMYGASVNELKVSTVSSGSRNTIWVKHGNQGPGWKKITYDLDNSAPTQFTLEISATQGTSFTGDIAIDDIQLSDGDCAGVGVTSLSCTFEIPCAYQNQQGDSMDWQIHSGSATVSSGPSTDHTAGTNSGQYLYIDTSGKSQGNNALYASPVNPKASGDFCIEFYYFLRGNNTGTLNVKKQGTGSAYDIWSRSSDQGTGWNKVQISQALTNTSKIIFEGVVGSRGQGVIAVDDISVTNSRCQRPPACNFEMKTICSWSNLNSDNFDWTVNQGPTSSTGTGPSVDHTKGTVNGSYIYTEASNQGSGDKAYLLSTTLPATGVSTYCFKFWFSMKGTSIGSLQVNYVVGGKLPGRTLWKLGQNLPSTDWNVGFIPITSSDEFKLLFIGTMGGSYQSDIAIDDINYYRSTCSLLPPSADPNGGSTTPVSTPAPTAPISTFTSSATSFDCDFETSKCAWQNYPASTTDGWLWGQTAGAVKSTIPVARTDHTKNSGAGHYIYYSFKSAANNKQLISPVMNLKGALCLRFWYMTSYNFRDLNVYVKQSTSSGSTITLKNGTSFTCDFEQTSICSFTQDTSDDTDWTRMLGSTSSVNTGPSSDHTYGTSSGYYMYLETSSGASGTTARLDSPSFVPVHQDLCVSFYYHMFGGSMGLLNVRLATAGQSGLGPILWSMTGNLGNQWNKGELTLHSSLLQKNVKIVFEAIKGSSYTSDIGLDDVNVKMGACITPATCNFERDLCSWINVPSADFDWQKLSGATGSYSTGPTTDHTTQTVSGHYLYLEASAPRRRGERVILSSERLPATNGSCFTFWYHMAGSGIGDLSIVLSASPSQNTTLWKLSGAQNNAWLSGQVGVRSPYSSFFIYVQGVRGGNAYGDIAIDDLGYSNAPCGINPTSAQPSSTPVTFRPASPTPPATGTVDCNFDVGFCSWSQDTQGDNFQWQRQAQRAHTRQSGPDKDHSGSGYFAYISTSAPQKNHESAKLVSPSIPAGDKCLTFWYYMWGDDVSTLKISRLAHSYTYLLWAKNGTQGNQWFRADLNIHARYRLQLVIEADVGSGPEGDIAIDDITISDGACGQSPLGVSGPTCDFEQGICGYSQDQTDDFDWIRGIDGSFNPNGGTSVDHTYMSFAGHYMYIRANIHTQGQKARLIDNSVDTGTAGLCVEFWYRMVGSGMGTLKLSQKKGTAAPTVLLALTGNQGSDWQRSSAAISGNQGTVQMIFEATRGSSFSGNIAIDDILVRNGTCTTSTGTCDFEKDRCSWIEDKSDDVDWVMGNGGTFSFETRPTNDHTFGNRSGTYLFTETSSTTRGDVARLKSALFPSGGAGCFHMFYNMYGAGIGTLRVAVATYNTGIDSAPETGRQVVWELSGNKGQGWKEGVVPIPAQTQNYRIVIEGVAGSSFQGDIGIDDLKYVPGGSPCVLTPSTAAYAAPTTTAPVTVPANIPANFNCDFESGLCGWTNTVSATTWQRHSGSTLSLQTGPSGDHTKGTGHYIYLETSSGRNGDQAVLSSPTGFNGNATQCLSFWYHMYGLTVNSLIVRLKGSSTTMDLWRENGTHGDHWIQAQVDIGGSSTGFANQVQFVAVHGSSYTGDIAVDDIKLVAGLCTSSAGSKSPINCDFEDSSLCGYIQDPNDDGDWRRNTMSTGSTGTGPTSDHTYGTSLGHYMYLEASNTFSNRLFKLWSPPFTYTDGQCVSFFYNMYGSTMGELSIYLGQLNTTGLYRTTRRLWALQGNQGQLWKQEYVPLPPSPSGQVNLVIVGKTGISYQSDMAFDDISLVSNCPSPGECSFEAGKCGWTSPFLNLADFVLAKASSRMFPNSSPPTVDHTTGTANGSYVILANDRFVDRGSGLRVQFSSEELTATSSSGICFHFWFASHQAVSPLSLNINVNGSVSTVWKIGRHETTTFQDAQAFVYSSSPYKLVFEANLLSQVGYFALDDFTITQGYCAASPSEAAVTGGPTAPVPTSSVTQGSVVKSNVDCDFESGGLCQWSQETNDDFDWTFTQGATGSADTGPTTDHTLKSNSGHYIFIEASYPQQPNDTAVIKSPKVTSHNARCLLFWYHMYGIKINTLNVYVMPSGQTRSLKWTRTGPQGSDWLEASVDITMARDYYILFEGIRGTDYQGDIGLDDIRLLPGSCTTDQTADRCNFETGLCDYQPSSYIWRRMTGSTPTVGTGPKTDHTYGTSAGHYMYTEASSPGHVNGGNYNLTGKSRPATAGQCVSYWYHMFGQDIGTLRVIATNGHPWLLSTHTDNKDQWLRNEVTVVSSTSWQLVFHVHIGNGIGSDIAIDDIVISEGACGKIEGSCDFEKDLCVWHNGLGRTWQRLASHDINTYNAPPTDHTITTNMVSVLVFVFLFPDYLDVYVGDDTLKTQVLLWSMPVSGRQSEWTLAQVPIPTQKNFYTITIVGIVGNSVYNALSLDDFVGRRTASTTCSRMPSNAVPGSRSTPTTPATPAGSTPPASKSQWDCNFESGLCNWTQLHSDDFDWTRAQGPQGTNLTGPTKDHSRGNNFGWYLYIASRYTSNPSAAPVKALLQSPALAASTTYCVQFYYMMFGPHVGSLNLYIPSSGSSPSSSNKYATVSGNQGNMWHKLTVTASSSSLQRNIIIEGVRGPSYLGDIAIDDISVTTGSCPRPSGPDCSFDLGPCGWTQSTADDFDWIEHSGTTSSYGTGPSNDHTLGTRYGKYYHMEASSPHLKDQYTYFVSPKLTTTSSQCFGFWYHMSGKDMGSLVVGIMKDSDMSSISPPFQPLWFRAGHQSSEWLRGEVTLDYPGEAYHVVFKGTVGTGYAGDIEVDDVSFRNTACEINGKSNFLLPSITLFQTN
ncbi:MAM and LDL-receptor class A domain-containing protein 1 [Aplysia californica]|uniref:MAM and LDL-receptor class A domain-containing protein 1 n=1 Tax=Aplysia californica TaxID=6500 RepID=A0ABM1VYX2_APLCA|nr:MAM and LDL-receptor class A domain-containing protein 1 [Aplysia californica]